MNQLWLESAIDFLAEEADELRQAFFLATVRAPREEVERAMRASDAARMKKVDVLRRVRLISPGHQARAAERG